MLTSETGVLHTHVHTASVQAGMHKMTLPPPTAPALTPLNNFEPSILTGRMYYETFHFPPTQIFWCTPRFPTRIVETGHCKCRIPPSRPQSSSQLRKHDHIHHQQRRIWHLEIRCHKLNLWRSQTSDRPMIQAEQATQLGGSKLWIDEELNFSLPVVASWWAPTSDTNTRRNKALKARVMSSAPPPLIPDPPARAMTTFKQALKLLCRQQLGKWNPQQTLTR